MSGEVWKEILALSDRSSPDLFEAGRDIHGSPYADEIRKAINLSVTAVFCVHGVPQIVILEQDVYDSEVVTDVHAALWNQGLASILVVFATDFIRVFSLSRAPGTEDQSQFEDRCLIEAIETGATALSLRNYVYGAESGRLWGEKSTFFDPKERIDHVLLRNLTATHKLLTEEGLSPVEAQAILIQTMFIAYLEDRGITTPDYFASATNDEYRSMDSLLSSGDATLLRRLFASLRRDFNGDLFVAPCSFDKSDHHPPLSATTLNILRRFRDGREEMAGNNGQLRFWSYNFKYIPVELISAVYDRFLGRDKEARDDDGAYYTPMFLVDTVVSSVWESVDKNVKDGSVFLDPACGSGIFLVRCFQRLCEHWRENANHGPIPWNSLTKMLKRVRGRDLNGGAVRIAVFSLYIALLEEVSPPDIRKLVKRGRLLPNLWNQTLVQRDFFEEAPSDLQVDVVIGNPPWGRKNKASSGIVWCRSNGYSVPGNENAWAFTWKAQKHVGIGGTVAFLLPAMGFLHNHTDKSIASRKRLFSESLVLRVVNLSDLRRQLFDGAVHPPALMVISKCDEPRREYRFDYWVPKADPNLAVKRFVAVSSADKLVLRLSDVEQNPSIFKERLWMRAPDAKLFAYLEALPKLSSFIQQYGPLERRKQDTSVGWIIGDGFRPFRAGGNSARPYESRVVTKTKHLPIGAFTPIAISTDGLVKWPSSTLRRKGFERAFDGPRILCTRGVATASMRLRATFLDEPVTFQDNIQGIVVPENETKRAKLITAVLNSRLVVWYAFHGTGPFGTAIPKVLPAELLRLPMPEPDDLADPARAKLAMEELVAIVEREQEMAGKLLRSPDNINATLREIDKYTYEYFGLSGQEITLVEDTVEYILPAAQPNAGNFPELWKQSTTEEREVYSRELASGLGEWFNSGTAIAMELFGSNQDFGILRLALRDPSHAGEYKERTDRKFTKALQTLSRALKRPIARNFQTMPDMRFFVGENLYLIKPMQRRFWLRSSALADANDIAADLQTLVETHQRRSLAS